MDRRQTFQNLLVMALADGSLSESEIGFLAERSTHWGISEDEFRAAAAHAVSPEAELRLPQSPPARGAMMGELIRMMAADGKLTEPERELFALAAARLGISPAELNEIIDTVLDQQDAG